MAKKKATKKKPATKPVEKSQPETAKKAAPTEKAATRRPIKKAPAFRDVLLNIKLTRKERELIQANADAYAWGNASRWVRVACLEHRPKK